MTDPKALSDYLKAVAGERPDRSGSVHVVPTALRKPLWTVAQKRRKTK